MSGRKLALIVANYEYSDLRLHSLKSPAKDIEALAHILSNKDISAFDEINLSVNQNADTLRKTINLFFTKKLPEDMLFFYYSGHGILDSKGRLFLTTKDTDLELIRATSIPSSFVVEEMDESRSKRQILILDCCYSGAVLQGAKAAIGTKVGTHVFEGNGYGRVVLSATDATQFAWEGDQIIGDIKESLFTHYFIEGVVTGDANPYKEWISIDDIYEYVYKKVLSHQNPQKSSYSQEGELIIARNPKPKISPTTISGLASDPLQKNEAFINKFFEGADLGGRDSALYKRTLLARLKQATGAKDIFIANNIYGIWEIGVNENLGGDNHSRQDLLNQIGSFDSIDWLSQNGVHATKSRSGDLLLIFPLTKTNTEILIFYGISEDYKYDNVFILIIRTITDATNGLRSLKTSDELELCVNNNLRKNYKLIPNTIQNRQLDLFNKSLEKINIEFEPITYLSSDAPSIFGWKSRARDISTSRKPMDLFETVETWGERFQLQLDTYFLEKTIELYVTDDKDILKLRRKHTILPLFVDAHPQSLLESFYFDTIKKISNQSFMPLNKLYLEISEKHPIPTPNDWDGVQNVIDAFRNYLYRYRDLDIHFSLDNFGAGGNTSLSRVGRLGPACLKLHRDVLTDNLGGFTLQFVITVVRRLPGDIIVIAEGFDEESVISLKKLYELGIRYIQGYKFGINTSPVDSRLSKEMITAIQNELR